MLTASDLMPTGEKNEAILRQRRGQLAQGQQADEEKKSVIDYVRFQIGKEKYGIPYFFAEEVRANVALTKIMKSAPFVAGVMNWRGNLLTILDLSLFFNLPKTSSRQNFLIIIVHAAGMMTGLLVDKLEGRDSYEEEKLIPPLSGSTVIQENFLYGLHHGEVGILNVKNILLAAQTQLLKEEK